MTEICMGDDRIWTSEWPTEPGKYWFYGFYFGHKPKDGLPKLGLVKVSKDMKNEPIRVLDGKFMYKVDGHIGFFSDAEDVVVPSLNSFEYLGLSIGMAKIRIYPEDFE